MALVALSALVADGTLASLDSFTSVPPMVSFFSLLPLIERLLICLPLNGFAAISTASWAIDVPLKAKRSAMTATIIDGDGRPGRMRSNIWENLLLK